MIPNKQKRSSRGIRKTMHRPPPRSFLHSQLRREKSIWVLYNEIAQQQDNHREKEWLDRTDTMLLFAGLFATFLSAFLVAIMSELKPDNTELTVDILKHISNQMHNISYGPYDSPPSTPDGLSVIANGLFFASLAFVLLTAFLSMLVKTWIRDFERDLPPPANAEERAKERESRFRGLIRYKLPVVNALPIMIQIALILFCVGLLIYLRPLRWSIFISTLSILTCGFGLYLFVIFVNRSVPLTALLSRASAYPRHVGESALLSLRYFYSAFVVPTVPNDDLSRRHPDFMFLGRIQRALRWMSMAQGAGGHTSLDAEVRIMNRIARETLVAPESAPIFVALAERLALDNGLRPCSASEWQEIITILRNTLSHVSSPLGKRGFIRIVTDVYDDQAIHHDTLGELVRKWLLEGIPSSLGTRHLGSINQGVRPTSFPSTSTTIPSTRDPGTDTMERKASLPLLAVLTLVPSTLVELKSLFFSGIGTEAVSHRIQDRGSYEAIRLDLSWLQIFLNSKLVSDFSSELKDKLKEETTRCLREVLIVTSFFPVDCSLLINAVLQVALANERMGVRNDPSVPRQTAEGSRELFIASSAAGWPSEKPLSFHEFFPDFVAFTSSAIKPEGVNASLVVPLLLALQRVDRTSSLYEEHRLGALITALPDLADQLIKKQGPLTHSVLMEVILSKLHRADILDGFKVFLEYWDHPTSDFSKPLDQDAFDFFDTVLTSIVGIGPNRIKGIHEISVLQVVGPVRNPWLRVQIDNIFGRRSEGIDLPHLCKQLAEVIWSGHSCHERIVERALDVYDRVWVTREKHLLGVFTKSNSFWSYMRCLVKGSSKPPFGITRLENTVHRLLRREVGEDLERDWFAIAQSHPLWSKLPADWPEAISKAFRSHNQFIDWLQRSMDFLGERLRQEHPESGSSTVANTIHDRRRLELAASAFLPFIWQLLSAAPSLITAEEADKLAKLDLKRLSDAFGNAEIRTLIEETINSPNLRTVGGGSVVPV